MTSLRLALRPYKPLIRFGAPSSVLEIREILSIYAKSLSPRGKAELLTKSWPFDWDFVLMRYEGTMKTSNIIFVFTLGLAILILSAQAGLAQPNRNYDSKGHYENSSPRSQRDGGREVRPQTGYSQNRPGDSKQYDQNNKGPGQSSGQHSRQAQAGSRNPGQGIDKSPGSHQGLNHHQARELAQINKMTGYKPLPPSTKRHMAPGKPIPQGIQLRPVPDHMRGKLPHHPGYEWRIAGTDLLLVAAGTLIISQIIENVFY